MNKEQIIATQDLHDTENWPVRPDGIERGQKARFIRQTRAKLGLSQTEFAARFRVPVGTLRDWEQARSTAPDFALAYMRVIALHPDIVAQAANFIQQEFRMIKFNFEFRNKPQVEKSQPYVFSEPNIDCPSIEVARATAKQTAELPKMGAHSVVILSEELGIREVWIKPAPNAEWIRDDAQR